LLIIINITLFQKIGYRGESVRIMKYGISASLRGPQHRSRSWAAKSSRGDVHTWIGLGGTILDSRLPTVMLVTTIAVGSLNTKEAVNAQ
jgi:hypothetical protein